MHLSRRLVDRQTDTLYSRQISDSQKPPASKARKVFRPTIYFSAGTLLSISNFFFSTTKSHYVSSAPFDSACEILNFHCHCWEKIRPRSSMDGWMQLAESWLFSARHQSTRNLKGLWVSLGSNILRCCCCFFSYMLSVYMCVCVPALPIKSDTHTRPWFLGGEQTMLFRLPQRPPPQHYIQKAHTTAIQFILCYWYVPPTFSQLFLLIVRRNRKLSRESFHILGEIFQDCQKFAPFVES
jgi:hypothetical protein